MSTLGLEEAKKVVAYHAVDELLQDKTVIGIGSGSTVVYAVQRIAEKVSQLRYNIRCIPSSFQARQLIIEHRLQLSDLDINPQIDITIDGADEAEVSTKHCIKGGGGCLLQEKIVASASKRLAIICDYNKISSHLGQKWKKGVPIEVVPMACTVVKRKIESTLGGQAVLRMAKAKAGPVVTDNSNFILDWAFDEKEGRNWHEINRTITMIPGVVETGLFLDMATHVYYCDKEGSVHKL